jgi:para-nitrobenzyl esterase
MGNLGLDKRYAWGPDDFKVSETMQKYFVNFIKSGDPNGPGLPKWPAYTSEGDYRRMRIDVESRAEAEPERARYMVLESATPKP